MIREGDAYTLRSSGPSSLAIDVTTDRSLLAGAIKRATGNGLKAIDALEVIDHALDPKELRYRARVAQRAAREMVTSAEHVRDRRKALIAAFAALPLRRVSPKLAPIAHALYRADATRPDETGSARRPNRVIAGCRKRSLSRRPNVART